MIDIVLNFVALLCILYLFVEIPAYDPWSEK